MCNLNTIEENLPAFETVMEDFESFDQEMNYYNKAAVAIATHISVADLENILMGQTSRLPSGIMVRSIFEITPTDEM